MQQGARILVLGADGFIGRHILLRARSQGFVPIGLARRTTRLEAMGFETLKVDLTDTYASDPDFWASVLKDVDAVINAAGLLTGSDAAFTAVHQTAPAALYTAAKNKPTVLLSAVGLDADTRFARHRQSGEDIARAHRVSILRAGLVLGDTSYGGSSLLRALSAMPFVLPVIETGTQAFNPIHANDLADAITTALNQPEPMETDIGGPQKTTLREMLVAYRAWLGLSPGRVLEMPMPFLRALGRLGDGMRLGPISLTAIKQLEAGVMAGQPDSRLPNARGFFEFLNARPAGSQDLWHARLYLLRPPLRIVLALLWFCSGLLGMTLAPSTFLPLIDTALPDTALIIAARLGAIVDLALAAAVLRGWRPKTIAAAQAVMVTAYTLGFTLLAPALWLLPLGGLLKNIPILTLITVSAILEDER